MNMNAGERFLRILVGGALLTVFSYLPLNTTLTWLLVFIALVLMLTGLAGYSPLYAFLKSKKK
ncbi:MAG TPA: DUF2892 domain-containing protein [Candidatus Sulfotelmatobacter sp.]|nr:DUF2892 domain-containing protein [Candidatus Sulfotelmatobacter sp.]